jgi:hypothetical protein
MDAKEYAYLTRRNAHLEEVNDYQRDRLDTLETQVKRLGDGLSETTRILTDLLDEVHALPQLRQVGVRCARCGDARIIFVGNGDGDDPYDSDVCPTCVTGREEPEFREVDLDEEAEE